jgi:hypothetical protein
MIQLIGGIQSSCLAAPNILQTIDEKTLPLP